MSQPTAAYAPDSPNLEKDGRALSSEENSMTDGLPAEPPFVYSKNPILRPIQKLQNFLGFHQIYNLPLWIIFGGAMIGFALGRYPYFNLKYAQTHLGGVQNWYWYNQSLYHYGLFLHLGGVVPGGTLAVFQFLPIIRKKALIYHRIAGYVAILLLLIGLSGAIIISRRAWGGEPNIQAVVFVIAFCTASSVFLAYYNIKRLQIDQHRKWMLRTWFYAASVITLRIFYNWITVMFLEIGSYSSLFSCDELNFILQGNSTAMAEQWPACTNETQPHHNTISVAASLLTPGRMGYESALRVGFGMATWTAWVVHALGVEMYIHLTPGESERLRRVSYEKQLARGLSHPGSAGITSDRWGDAEPWTQRRPVTTRV